MLAADNSETGKEYSGPEALVALNSLNLKYENVLDYDAIKMLRGLFKKSSFA